MEGTFMKTYVVALLVMLLVYGLIGYQTQAAEKQLVVGYSHISTGTSLWRRAEKNSVQSEAAKRGIELKFSDANGAQAMQIGALRTFITEKVDAIILAPRFMTGWEPVLKEAKAANIPVFLIERAITVSDPDLYVTLLASDYVYQGEQAGKCLAEKLHYTGNIVEIQGTPGTSSTIDRKQGFEQIISQYPDLKIIQSRFGGDRAGGKTAMRGFLLNEGKNIHAVYAHYDEMALGAIQAIEDYGLKPGTDIVLVSIDGIKEAFEAMVAGKLNCTIENTPLYGPGVFDAIEKYRAGEQLPKWIKSADQTFPMEVAKDVIGTRKY
jgi:galactofuranose transport system substrate-binding protein